MFGGGFIVMLSNSFWSLLDATRLVEASASTSSDWSEFSYLLNEEISSRCLSRVLNETFPILIDTDRIWSWKRKKNWRPLCVYIYLLFCITFLFIQVEKFKISLNFKSNSKTIIKLIELILFSCLVLIACRFNIFSHLELW